RAVPGKSGLIQSRGVRYDACRQRTFSQGLHRLAAASTQSYSSSSPAPSVASRQSLPGAGEPELQSAFVEKEAEQGAEFEITISHLLRALAETPPQERERLRLLRAALRKWSLDGAEDPRELALRTPLTEDGYSAVARLCSSDAMVEFVKRVISAAGGKVLKPAELEVISRWYSGELGTGSLAALEEELQDQDWIQHPGA
ncbi:unnamed protein product, partial [Polarella glacialis]